MGEVGDDSKSTWMLSVYEMLIVFHCFENYFIHTEKNTPQKYSDLKKETFKMSLAKNLAYLIKLYIILIIKAAEIKFSVASDPLNWNMWKTLNSKGTCNWCSIWVTILIYMRTKPILHGYNSYQNGTCEFVIKCHQNMPVFLIFSKLSFLKQVLNQYIRIFG